MTVFIVQNVERRNESTGLFEPVYDFSSCEVYGKPHFLLNPGRSPHQAAGITADLMSALMNFSDDDYILPTGNPVLISMAATVAAGYNGGRVKFLLWDKRAQKYHPIPVDLPIFR